ncbi:MAG TPA: DMT family transporter [Pseudolabrys sp.]|nr:DMT family transporter [Pseudolabrys sp.]
MTAPTSDAPERPAPAAHPAKDHTVAGIALMLVGIFFFSVNDTMGKYLVGTYAVGQILLMRSAAAIVILAPFIKREGLSAFRNAPRPGLQVLRAVFATLEVFCFYWALTGMSLADTMTFYLAGPIYVTAMSPLLLREHVGWRRWIAVLVGFVGVMIALGPSGGAFSPHALVAIAGSLMFSVFMVCTRLVRGTSDVVLLSTQVVAALIFGAVTAPFTWVAVGLFDGALLALLGVVAMVAFLCINRSLSVAPASVVVPYQYTAIVWAVLLGFIFFGDIPSTQMLIGAGIIIAAGIYIFIREQQLSKPPAFTEPPPA